MRVGDEKIRRFGMCGVFLKKPGIFLFGYTENLNVLNEKQFDVKQGKLVTVYRCKRYGEIKSRAL